MADFYAITVSLFATFTVVGLIGAFFRQVLKFLERM